MARTSPRRWRSGWAPAPASTTSPLTGSRRRDSPTAGSSRLEEPFLELTGAPLRLETFEDATSAWNAARAAVDRGRPAILLTDLYHLDHYGKSAHFPGHAVVLAGYDDYLSDTSFEDLQRTRSTSAIDHAAWSRSHAVAG